MKKNKKLLMEIVDINITTDNLDKLLGGMQNRSILNIGCGGGTTGKSMSPFLSRELYNRGIKVFGLDIDKGLEKEKFNHKVIDVFSDEFYNLFDKNTFDAVVTRGFWCSPDIEQKIDCSSLPFEDKKKFMKKVYSILKPKGVYYNYDWGVDKQFFYRVLGMPDLKDIGYSFISNDSVCSDIESGKKQYHERNIMKKE